MRHALIAAFLTLPVTAHAQDTGPSFDCSKAVTDPDRAICADPDLSALDREMARVYSLVKDERAAQRAWWKEKNACSEGTCLRDAYATRIDTLRRSHKVPDGASRAPVIYKCDGWEPVITATFVNAGAPLVVLTWLDTKVVLPTATSASGARYQGPTPDGPAEFWTKGTEATFMPPGSRAGVACKAG